MRASPDSFIAVLLTLGILLSGETQAQNALPSFIKQRCSASDPEFNSCLTGATRSIVHEFAKGIKELNIPSIDPVTLNKIDIDVPGLKITFSNVTLLGLSRVRIDDFKKNLATNKAVFDYTANLIMKGHYKMDGRIVVLPIQGDGDFVIHLTNMSFHLKYKFDTVKGDGGRDYWTVTSYKQTYKLDRATFDLTNLYNGNQFLAETTLRFINENWELIMKDIAPAAVEQICDKCVSVTNKFFSKVPLEELILP